MENYDNKLLVLIINDMVVLPNTEIRIEYDNIYDKQMIDIVDRLDNNLMLIVNPLEENFAGITSLPQYGILGKLKWKINVPNGKTRVVIEGLERVHIQNYYEEGEFFKATYEEALIESTKDDESYFNILLKSLDNYVDKVPYMGNAIISQVDHVDTLTDLCDLIASFIPISYHDKKKYVTTISPIERTKMLLADMNKGIKLIDLERKIEREVEDELNESQREYFLREKIKIMQKELGEVNGKDDEIEVI